MAICWGRYIPVSNLSERTSVSQFTVEQVLRYWKVNCLARRPEIEDPQRRIDKEKAIILLTKRIICLI